MSARANKLLECENEEFRDTDDCREPARIERASSCHVHNLDTALEAYWASGTPRENQAAYHEILLFGGLDGYPGPSPYRAAVARALRRLALWVERRK